MLFFALLLFSSTFPWQVQSSCCRLPFTSSECQVKREGPHRYQIMPDLQSGLVQESTECVINDFDAKYRKVIETKNYCNDCPGLLILQTNSSEIFLFPEYLERILEGRTLIQRKNVIILTTSLVGTYDIDFTLLARYYANRPLDEVPSIYVDLQLPRYNPRKSVQPSLLLRLPMYSEDREGIGKLDRKQVVDPSLIEPHHLPYLYHFDITKHRYPPSLCNLYRVNLTSSLLVWTRLDSADSTCHHYKHFFGKNPCFATGFSNLFCPIDINVESGDHLELSVYLSPMTRVGHLTVAAMGGEYVSLSLSNAQLRPAERVKILVLQGHLIITDVNQDLHIRVEYGSNCEDFSILVPDGLSATRYRRFDGETFITEGGSRWVDLPRCFRLVPSPGGNTKPLAENILSLIDRESDPAVPIHTIVDQQDVDYPSDEVASEKNETQSGYWQRMTENSNFLYIIVAVLILLAFLPLCLGLLYRVYCNPRRQSSWVLDHSHDEKKTEQVHKESSAAAVAANNPGFVDHETQTKDVPIRI